jgi:hypothetical protein
VKEKEEEMNMLRKSIQKKYRGKWKKTKQKHKVNLFHRWEEISTTWDVMIVLWGITRHIHCSSSLCMKVRDEEIKEENTTLRPLITPWVNDFDMACWVNSDEKWWKWWEVMRSDEKWWEVMRSDEKWREVMRSDEKWWEVMRSDEKWWEVMRSDEKWWEVMRSDEKW